MTPELTVAAVLSGYLLGSISFARIVVRLKTGGKVQPMDMVTPDGGGRLYSTSVTATAVRLQLGARWGVLTGVLDILKAFAPTLAWRLLYPERPYLLLCAAAAVFGHNWPLYHRFRGGNGQSVILGGVLAIDWIGALVTNGFATLVGLTVAKDGMFGDVGGIPLLIPWMWWRFDGDPWYIGYAVVVNVAWLISFWPALRQYIRMKREGHLPTPEHSIAMFRMDFRFMRRLAPRRYAEIDRVIEQRRRSAAQEETPTGIAGGMDVSGDSASAAAGVPLAPGNTSPAAPENASRAETDP